MNSHKNAGGIGVNWCVFGSSGHKAKPEGKVLENYTMHAERNAKCNRLIKTICDPMKILAVESPHFPIYCRGFYNLDENGNIIIYSITDTVNFEKIRVNHYPVKSQEEFAAKKQKGNITSLKLSTEYFDEYDRNEVKDTEILSRA